MKLAALVCLAALLVAGCGSDSNDAASDKPDLNDLREVAAATQSTQAPTSLRGVFDDAQAMWKREFENAGSTYAPATLTIFHGQVDTACGTETVNTGPFYCPADRGVYLDTRFFAALGRATGVQIGFFAQAYVVAHEVGHHVQALLGILRAEQSNARSVRVELQADCLAGIWKHSAYRRDQITPADFAEALRAAAVVGSDFQQKLAGGAVTPEDWTHGSSAQRQHWLTLGFQSGQPGDCDTFAVG
jgi:predicted metalloprotease